MGMRCWLLIAGLVGCGGESASEPACQAELVENEPGPGCLFVNVDGDQARLSLEQGACGGPACLNVAQGQPVYLIGSSLAVYTETGPCEEIRQCD